MNRFMMFVIIVSGLAWWFWGRTVEPAKVVHAQLEAIGNHDYEKAYSYLSAGLKSRVSLGQFQERIERNRIIASNYTSDFLDRKFENNVLRLSGTVRALGGESTPARFVVVKEGGRWVIQEYEY
jgi:hypothetical protein